MAFGMNEVNLIGRLGADPVIRTTDTEMRIANLSVATDSSWKDRQSGEWINRTEWHRVVTFQAGLVDLLERQARTGRLALIKGRLQTKRWRKDGEETDRYSTEILVAPDGRIQFLDKWDGQKPPSSPDPKEDDDIDIPF